MSRKCCCWCLAWFVLSMVSTVNSWGADPPKPTGKFEYLWPDAAPLADGTAEEDRPGIWIYPAPREKNTSAAVVVCPGGGYQHLALGHEGEEIAQFYNAHGITAVVVRYRLGPKYQHPVPLLDAQRAVRTTRQRAKEWGVDPNRIGIMGFSAGGHLASTVITHFDQGDSSSNDPIEQQSSRPDFAVLCYPVIAIATEFAHEGSKNNLLGKDAPAEMVASLSNERNVTAETPPTFLFHTAEDKPVPPENSVLFYLALRKAGVPCEMHIYEKGPHGVGLAAKDPVLSSWPTRLLDWLEVRGITKK